MNESDNPVAANEIAQSQPLSRRSFLGVLLGFGTVIMFPRIPARHRWPDRWE